MRQANQGALEIRTRIVNTATTLPPARKQAAVSAELDKVKLELQAERARRQRLMEMFDAQTKSANLP